MPRKKKTMKIDLRAKIIDQLLDVTGSSIDSWNPAIISDDMKLISYIRNISDTWNPSQLNEALKLLGFRTVDTWNPAQLEETKNNLVQYFLPKIATGNPIELNLAGNLPYTLETAKVTMLPIQDLHGYSNPWAGGEGKNRLDIGSRVNQTTANIVYTSDDNYITMNGTKKGGGYANLSSLTISLEAGTYYARAFVISGTSTYYPYIYLFDGTENLNTSSMLGEEREITIDTAKTCTIRVGIFTDGQVFTNYKIGIVISKTSGITSWSPYSNICPISGRDSVNLVISDGESEGETYTATFPSTVYGGEYEFVSGKLTDEWANIASYNGETLPAEWISDRDVYVADTTPTIGAQVAYKTTPTETTLTPQFISLSKGENVINSNADNIELNYKINFN